MSKNDDLLLSVCIKLLWFVLFVHTGWYAIATVLTIGHFETSFPKPLPSELPFGGSGGGSSRRKEVFFNSTNGDIHAWFYTPRFYLKKRPIVLLSHGLGGQKDMGLEPYCLKFLNAGFACLAIDYRTFGGSSSLKGHANVRNWINPWMHVDDIKHVVRSIENGQLGKAVDKNKIALWGTSFAGGHVLRVAADFKKEGSIKAVISQVPHLDGRAASKRSAVKRGVLGTVRMAILALSDIVRSYLPGMSPVFVKIVGTTKETAYMNLSPTELSTYYAKHPSKYLGGWKNIAPARTAAILSLYNPIDAVKDVAVPILFVGATQDTLCPVEFVRLAAKRAMHPGSKLITVDSNHFGIYQGPNLEYVSTEMIRFLLDAFR